MPPKKQITKKPALRTLLPAGLPPEPERGALDRVANDGNRPSLPRLAPKPLPAEEKPESSTTPASSGPKRSASTSLPDRARKTKKARQSSPTVASSSAGEASADEPPPTRDPAAITRETLPNLRSFLEQGFIVDTIARNIAENYVKGVTTEEEFVDMMIYILEHPVVVIVEGEIGEEPTEDHKNTVYDRVFELIVELREFLYTRSTGGV